MPSDESLVRESLIRIAARRLCIVGVGNRMRGDDGAGPALIDLVRGKVNAACFDAGTAPENFLEKIVKTGADTVLVIDCMEFSAAPGSIRVFDPADLSGGGLSTHALSLQMMCDYLSERSDITVHLVGIQPKRVKLGEELSNAADNAVRCLADILAEMF